MTLLEEIKILTSEANEQLLQILIDKVKLELETLLSRPYEDKWDNVCSDMVIVKYNRRHNEGISSVSVSDMSENYSDTYPTYILNQLSKFKKNVRFF